MTVLQNLIEAPVQVQKRDRAQVIEEAKILLGKVGLSEKRMFIRGSSPAVSSSV